jgi:hypothetical protein
MMSSGFTPCRGEPGSPVASATACWRTLSQPCWIAVPTLAMVVEPPCGPVGGMTESPSRNSTVFMVSPSASAATWGMEV